MQLSEEFIKDFEIEYLKIIVKLLNSSELKVEEAKDSAVNYLPLLPFSDMNDLQEKTKKFIEKYPWAQGLNIFILKKIEDSKTSDVLNKMRSLMRGNKIDEALAVAKPTP